jgi:hypothetical protein
MGAGYVYSFKNFIYMLKLELSHYTPRRRLGREDVKLLLILDLCTRWGWMVSVTPRPRFSPGEGTPVPIVQEAG